MPSTRHRRSKRLSPSYLPTPNQIVEACHRIRQTWSPDERQRRLVGSPLGSHPRAWSPPIVRMSRCTARGGIVVSELTS